MLHSNFNTNVIGTQKSVYRDSSLGNLDRTQVSETVSFVPLQDRFDSDNKACLPVAVHNQTTPALIQRIVSRLMPRVQCTAFRAPFGSVVSVNFVKRYLKHFAIGFEEFLKLAVGNSVDFLIGFLVKPASPPFEIFKFLDRNISIVSFSQIYNLFGNLAASCLDEIRLIAFKLFKALSCPVRAFVSKAFELSSSFNISSLPYGNIPAEVKLLDDFGSFGIENSNGGEGRRTDVNAKNIPLAGFWLDKFLFKNNGYSAVSQKRDVIKSPTIAQKGIESLELPVCSDGYGKRLLGRIGDFKAGVSSFSFNISKPSLIEADRAFDKLMTVIQNIFSAFPNILTGFLDNIAWQEGGFSYV